MVVVPPNSDHMVAKREPVKGVLDLQVVAILAVPTQLVSKIQPDLEVNTMEADHMVPVLGLRLVAIQAVQTQVISET